MEQAAILLAAGSGSRMRGFVEDKLFAEIAGKPIFQYSLEAFANAKDVSKIVVVYRDDEQRVGLGSILSNMDEVPYTVLWARGGNERQDSVFNGLEALTLSTDAVCIHDCARPLIRPEFIDELFKAATKDKAAVLAHRVTDTIKQTPSRSRGRRRVPLKDLQRNRLWAMETPQAFRYELIFEAYREVRLSGEVITDDTAAVALKGTRVTIIENPYPNIKVTLPQDIRLIEYFIENPVEIEISEEELSNT